MKNDRQAHQTIVVKPKQAHIAPAPIRTRPSLWQRIKRWVRDPLQAERRDTQRFLRALDKFLGDDS